MKRTLLVIISLVLILASAFGFYAAYTGLEEVPGIQRNKNLQAADIEDAIDLIEENLDEYNEMVALQEEIDAENAAAEEGAEGAEGTDAAGVAGTETPAATAKVSPARTVFGKPQRSLAPSASEAQLQYEQAQMNVGDCQAAYDAAQQKVSTDQANLNAAQEKLSSSQEKVNSLSNSVASANSAYSEYQSAKENYDSIPSWLYSSKSSAKSAMDSAQANYQSALNGYSSIDAMENDLSAAKQAVNTHKNAVSDAGQQLAADQQAMNSAKSNLDSANSRLSSARANLDAAHASQNGAPSNSNGNNNTSRPSSTPGIINNITNAIENNEKKEEEKEADKNVEKTAEKLSKLKGYGDVEEIVENGIEILLDNKDIAEKVSDKENPSEVIKASREYLDETKTKVDDELNLRQQLYFFLRILSIAGMVAGVFGIIVSIVPKRAIFAFALIFSLLTAIAAAVLNAFGYMNGYLGFIYTLADGSGTGMLQLYAMLAILAAAILSFITVAFCLKSFKKALKKRKLRQHLVEETQEAARRRAKKAANAGVK